MRTAFLGLVPAILIIGLIVGAYNLKSFFPKSTRTCELGECPLVIHDTDTGKRFMYREATQFTVYLNEEKNPRNHLRCEPSGVIGEITNAPETQPPFYAAIFEGVATGTCVLYNDNFAARIVIL